MVLWSKSLLDILYFIVSSFVYICVVLFLLYICSMQVLAEKKMETNALHVKIYLANEADSDYFGKMHMS